MRHLFEQGCTEMCWKGAFSGFSLLERLWARNLWLSFLKFWGHLWFKFSQYINFCDLEDAQRCVEKVLFPAFAWLSACEQGAFGSLCSSFEHISETNFLNISMSRNGKMIVDVVKKSFSQLFACLSDCEQDAFEGFCWKVVDIPYLFYHYIKTAKKKK